MRTTPCYSAHVKAKAKMIEFGGFLLPVSYTSLMEEHLNVRKNVGLFEVSHMGEIFVSGKDALSFLQHLLAGNVSINPNQAIYTVVCNEKGGILDDLIAYRISEESFFLCANASNTEKIFYWLQKNKENRQVVIENRSADFAQFAIQGPKAVLLVSQIFSKNCSSIPRFCFATEIWNNKEIFLSRTGYTGEDGFEIYLPHEIALPLWEEILSGGKSFGLLPCGLGARDTLRLEQGYLLYGNDIDEATTPLEAGLKWTLALKKEFIGREALLLEQSQGVSKNLVSFVMEERSIPRKGSILHALDGSQIGQVTSGTFSPSLEIGIGLGYVDPEKMDNATHMLVAIRKKFAKCRIVSTPLVKGSLFS